MTQKRIYHRSSEGGVQRFRPYGWICFQDGVIAFDKDVEENYLPFPERQLRKGHVRSLPETGEPVLILIAGQTKLHVYDRERKLTLCELRWHESFGRPQDRIVVEKSKICEVCFPGEKG